VYAWPVAASGTVVAREFKLLPGTYRLYCGVGNHRALGMQATLVVTRRAP
jgi:plastocyanin